MQVHGFFCEDIRREVGETDSVIGIMRDNMIVPSIPGVIAKFGVYIRIRLDLDDNPQSISTIFKTPWSAEAVSLGSTSPDLIQKALSGARENGLPFAGIIVRAVMAGFEVQGFGIITASVIVDGQEHVAAILNIRPPTTGATVSAQPALQSPPAAPS